MNDFDIKVTGDRKRQDAVVKQMIHQAKILFSENNVGDADMTNEDEIDYIRNKEFKELFKSMKFKFDAEGRV